MAKPNDQHDFSIWNRFRKGNNAALSEIYSQNARSLYQYGLKFTSNSDIIEDTIHELFIDLIRNRNTIGETGNILFYLLKSFRRKLLRQLKYELRYCDEEPSESMFDIRYSVEQELIHEETRGNNEKRLLSAIGDLSPRQKEAVYLRFKKGLDYGQISGIMDMSVEAARNLVYRAIKSLKDILG